MIPMVSENQRVFQFELPLREKTNKSGDQDSLNLNVFRNLHFYKLSYQKKSFQKRMRKPLASLPKLGKVWLHYEIHPRNKGRLDTMNPGSVLDKFFSDALVENGVIEDDDYNHVVFNSFCFGSVNPSNPHALVTIRELEPRRETTDMRILLDQDDIQQALETYVESMGIAGSNGVELSVEDGEIVAEVTLGEPKPARAQTSKPTPRTKNKGGRPPGSKNKPKEPQENTDAGLDVSGEDRDDSDDSGDTDGAEEETPEQKSDQPADKPKPGTKGKASALFDEEDDQPADDPQPKAGGKQSKNLFEESPEESSKSDDQTEEEGSDTETVKPAGKKSSIFDA